MARDCLPHLYARPAKRADLDRLPRAFELAIEASLAVLWKGHVVTTGEPITTEHIHSTKFQAETASVTQGLIEALDHRSLCTNGADGGSHWGAAGTSGG
jgi:hypothetical protein